MSIWVLIIFLFPLSYGSRYYALQTLPDRQSVVHLFEWKWTDIANECETFLSKYKYGAVQISPPNEHLMKTVRLSNGTETMPWWIRYQPVSYKLEKSRSGTMQEFVDMVNRCNRVGVRIIVDAVINHMAIVGQKYPGQYGTYSSAGTYFDASDGIESFPGVPYSNLDFHDPLCSRNIQSADYQSNAYGVRMCRLDGLLDLDHGKDYVRRQIADYLNRLIDLGVAGIRIDAVKHMWPADLNAILGMLHNLNETIFGKNQRPFIVQEVIDRGGESVSAEEYLGTGRVTNFRYGIDLSAAVLRYQNFKYFTNFGPGWAYWPDEFALVFVDNHDNQRDHDVLTYQNGQKYIMAVTYMLAWTYGYPRVMSGYYFTERDQGPPSSGSDFATSSPIFQSDETCSSKSGWVCEHRWPSIRRMVVFRHVVQGTSPSNVIAEDHRIAFRRGNKGFFALNNADYAWERKFHVGMPEGYYCDVISGEYDEKTEKCTGQTIQIDSDGDAQIKIPAGFTLAIHIEQRVPSSPIPMPPPLPVSFRRTVIMIHKDTELGQNLFFRGGLDQAAHGCQGDQSAYSSHCSIPIAHRTNVSQDVYTYYSWSQEDKFFDWFGAEVDQGTYDGIPSEGSPLAWTTNDPSNVHFHPLNKYGADYWLIDLMMDCGRTDNGWFSLRSSLKLSMTGTGVWENDIAQTGKCTGNAEAITPRNIGQNHAGLCGFINVFKYGQNDCEINRFSSQNCQDSIDRCRG